MRYTHRSLSHLLAATLLLVCVGTGVVESQITLKGPQPGDVYKEFYRAIPPNNTEAWRVTDPNVSLTEYPQAAPFLPNPSIDISVSDLSGAIRAEAVISMWGGHVGTTGKKIRFNGNSWINIPELGSANGIPSGHSGQCYLNGPTVVLDVPLGQLRTGTNYFEGTNTGQTCYGFGWGQHGWYNLMLRIYYEPSSKSHPTGNISSVSSGGTLGENPTITTQVTGGSVDRIDVLASYYNYSSDGDGLFNGYHYDYYPLSTSESSMNLRNHVGTATGSNRSVSWATDWVPDQAPGGIKLIAHLRDGSSGVWYCTQEVSGVSLVRNGTSVKLYTPYDMPEDAWARGDLPPFVTHVNIPSSDNLGNATAAVYHVRTWNGIDGDADWSQHYRRLNDWTDGDFGANHFYSYDLRSVPVGQLRQGTNTFTWYSATTAHHGMEILWPGPALVVRYSGTPSNNPPSITQQPSDRSVSEGKTATFSVGATGTLPLSYQWQKNGGDINGATSATYVTPPVSLSDNNSTFRCVVKNSYGTVTSNSAKLTVTAGGVAGNNVLANSSFESGTSGWIFYTNGAGQFTTVAPGTDGASAGRLSIASAGTNVQLFQSGISLEPSTEYTLSFDAYASAARTISVSVQKHDSPYTNYGLSSKPCALGTSWQSYSFTFTTSGFSSAVSDARLMFWLADVDAAGDQYTFDNVVLSTAGGSTPTGPTITSHPGNQSVSEGQTATFAVGASGTAPLSYQWQKNGGDISGATNASYTTPAVSLADNGATYRCVVKNNYGTATSNSATLTVTAGGGGGGTNAIANGSFESGTGSWIFYTNGSGNLATVTPGTSGASAARISIASAGTNVQLFQSGIVLEAGVQYTLTFDAYASSSRTISVSLIKHVSPYSSYGLSERPVSLGTGWQTFSFTFTSSGFTGTATDGRLMIWLAEVDAAGDQYFFDNFVLSKPGSGTPTAPSITMHPTNQTASVGQTATFTVGATGTAPLSYQWQKNSSDIGGATGSSYTTPAVAAGDNGATFRCVVKNSLGTATSNSATLTVTTGGGGGTNVLANGSFESGTSGWNFYSNGSAAFSTVTPGTNGSSAGRASISAAGTNVQLYQYGFTLEAGAAYNLTFDAYANAPRTISASVIKHVSPYSSYGLSYRPVVLGTSWQSYSIAFTTSGFSGTVTDPRLMIWLADVGAAGDQYYFDNFVLSKAASGSPQIMTSALPGNQLPTATGISDVYPNPFNPSTNIRYMLLEPATVTLRIYSVLGQEVATLVDGIQAAGVHSIVWDGRNSSGAAMGSGVYLCRMTGATERGEPVMSVKRMMLLK